MANVRFALLLSSIFLLAPMSARAQDGCPPDNVGCHSALVDFQHRDALFDDVMLDSGWVPSGAPLQVRFAVSLGGSTQVDLGGTAVTWWPAPLSAAIFGRPATGHFAINYGIEIIAMLRIDVTVAGVHYTWTGDIPIPGDIPRDLRFFDEATFDPFVLPPSEPRPIMLADVTSPITALDVDITDALIPIPGIGGGFRVDAVGELASTYRTNSIEMSDAMSDVTEEGASVVVRADPGADELGAAKDYQVLPHGTIGYQGSVTLYPTLYVEIAGQGFDLVLTEVSLPIVDLSSNTNFNTAPVHVPLPDVRVEPSSLTFTEAGEQLLTVNNDGEAQLSVRPADLGAPFALSSTELTLPPHSSQRIAVRFEPGTADRDNAILLLRTNDPDEPTVAVPLSSGAVGDTDASTGEVDGGVGPSIAGGCSCRIGATGNHSNSLIFVAIALGMLFRRRRL